MDLMLQHAFLTLLTKKTGQIDKTCQVLYQNLMLAERSDPF